MLEPDLDIFSDADSALEVEVEVKFKRSSGFRRQV